MTKKLLIVCASVVVGLIGAEIGLRILNYPYIGCKAITGVTEAKSGRYDPVLGWLYIPASSTTIHGITYTFNAEGYRTEHTSDRTDFSKPIMLLVGDSTLFGDGLNFTDTFSYQLQKRLADRYTVLNFSVQGYGLDQIYLRLQEVMRLYHPQYVIMDVIEDQDYRDSVSDRRYFFPCNVTSGTKPLFVQNAEGKPVQIVRPATLAAYDTPRLRLVWRRLLDSIRFETEDKVALSGALYTAIKTFVESHRAVFLPVNYQLSPRWYETDATLPNGEPLSASYSAELTRDGFHPTAAGMSRLVDDFVTYYGAYFAR